MIPRIKHIEPRDNFTLYIVFDDNKSVIYDVKDDIMLESVEISHSRSVKISRF